jgi:secretion/DNA translocation related TadE-like protein
MRDRGSGTVLVIGLIGVTIAVGLSLVAATQIVVARARAVAAADAAALAAAPVTFPPVAQGSSPLATANTIAEANGARLIACQCPVVATFEPRAVEVLVEVPVDLMIFGHRFVQAASRAEFVP